MLWRLGVLGPWDRFRDDTWDYPRPALAADGGLFQKAGWVARLDSGYSLLEIGRRGSRARLASRDQAIVEMLDRCDTRAIAAGLDPSRLAYYDEDTLAAARDSGDTADKAQLRAAAERALSRGPVSVVDKSSRAPSGDPHDYSSPARYWWPNPGKPDSLPFIRRDGEQAPGTGLFEAGSEAYDRSRLQQMLDGATLLALAATVFGDRRFAKHAAALVRVWFIDPATRMNRHLRYAQVQFGHNDNEGVGFGIIDFKDLYFFLDAVRLIERTGALSKPDGRAFRSWLGSYAEWLDTAPAGRFARRRANNHGVFFDLQRVAIAAYLADGATIAKTGLYARERLIEQIAADGSLPRELSRPRQRHYVMFGLQGWTALARLLSPAGVDFWRYRAAEGQGLGKALGWLATHFDTLATNANETREVERIQPLLADLGRHRCDKAAPAGVDAMERKTIFHPDCAIPPFWIWRRP